MNEVELPLRDAATACAILSFTTEACIPIGTVTEKATAVAPLLGAMESTATVPAPVCVMVAMAAAKAPLKATAVASPSTGAPIKSTDAASEPGVSGAFQYPLSVVISLSPLHVLPGGHCGDEAQSETNARHSQDNGTHLDTSEKAGICQFGRICRARCCDSPFTLHVQPSLTEAVGHLQDSDGERIRPRRCWHTCRPPITAAMVPSTAERAGQAMQPPLLAATGLKVAGEQGVHSVLLVPNATLPGSQAWQVVAARLNPAVPTAQSSH